MKRFLVGILVGVLLAIGGGYAYFTYLHTDSVADILEQKDAYDGETVRVRGVVGDRISVMGNGYYWLNDGGEKIRVVIVDQDPQKGETVTVKGRVKVVPLIGPVILPPEAPDPAEDRADS